VSPGLAITPAGEELFLRTPDTVDLSGVGAGRRYVVIAYDECFTHPVPAPGGGEAFSRVRECAVLRLVDALAPDDDMQVALAEVRLRDGGGADVDEYRRMVPPNKV
jgi:hypothetical protein